MHGQRKISSHNTLVILDSYFEGKGMKEEKIKLVPWVKLSFVTKCELEAYRFGAGPICTDNCCYYIAVTKNTILQATLPIVYSKHAFHINSFAACHMLASPRFKRFSENSDS